MAHCLQPAEAVGRPYVTAMSAPLCEKSGAWLAGRLKYALSPRTDLYLTAAKARARHGRRAGLGRDEAGFGSSRRSIMAGIQHRFRGFL